MLPACTELAAPIRVRLERKDLEYLAGQGVDIPAFITRAVKIQIQEMKAWR